MELNELHEKGININELLRKMLIRRKEEIAQKKREISEKTQTAKSRYIPAETRKLLQEEYGENCSMEACKKPAKIIHHTQRFSLSQNHNPKFLAPMCHEHHVIAHSIDIKYQKIRVLHEKLHSNLFNSIARI